MDFQRVLSLIRNKERSINISLKNKINIIYFTNNNHFKLINKIRTIRLPFIRILNQAKISN